MMVVEVMRMVVVGIGSGMVNVEVRRTVVVLIFILESWGRNWSWNVVLLFQRRIGQVNEEDFSKDDVL